VSGAAHLLVVDDDERLLALLQRFLTRSGHLVSVAADAETAKRMLEGLDFDLVVLDVMLPGQDGVELTAELRRSRDLPILLLTAKGESGDRIAGLEAGADDYLVKPFEPRELLLRIATILRRTRALPSPQPEGRSGVLRFGAFSFDLDSLELTRDEGDVVHLTSGELALLRVLAERAGAPISRAELGELSNIKGNDRAVDVQVLRLRRKLEDDPRQPRLLLTVRGEGYALRTGR
jgi:two-component system, OmpR family, phosphate regulon response regulator OmpR